MAKAVPSGGTVLDLQVIRPNPRVEIGDEFFCEVDGEPLFRRADAAVSAVDALIGQGRLSEQAICTYACCDRLRTAVQQTKADHASGLSPTKCHGKRTRTRTILRNTDDY